MRALVLVVACLPALASARPATEEATAAADTWLDALAARDATRFVASTRLPLWVEGVGRCRGRAQKPKQLGKLRKCLFGARRFLDSLAAHRDDPAVVAPEDLPASLSAYRKKLEKAADDHVLVLTMDGSGASIDSGATFDVVLLVTDAGGVPVVDGIVAVDLKLDR